MTGVVAIIDYGSGNLRSAEKALARAVSDGGLGAQVVVTSDANEVGKAERIVLPGVGAFADCMRGLRALDGMTEALEEAVQRRRVPFLGICVGMQLMASRGLEHGTHAGLGWIEGDVVRIPESHPSLKIPHMGWNTLRTALPHPVLDQAHAEGAHAYFVHSYAFAPKHDRDVVAFTDYGSPIAAVVARDNMIGTQFHPEKSQAFGLQLLQSFVRWRP